MQLEIIDIDQTTRNVKGILEKENELSPAFRSSLEVFLSLVTLLVCTRGRCTRGRCTRGRVLGDVVDLLKCSRASVSLNLWILPSS